VSTSTELRNATDEQFRKIVGGRRRARMDQIDQMPQDLRQCVHDYGYTVVKSFVDLGISKPKHLRHLVETVLNELSPTRGAYSSQGKRAEYGQ
jgi:hypothetical protein